VQIPKYDAKSNSNPSPNPNPMPLLFYLLFQLHIICYPALGPQGCY